MSRFGNPPPDDPDGSRACASLARRHDRGLYLKPALDPQLKAAIDLLKAGPILARGAEAGRKG